MGSTLRSFQPTIKEVVSVGQDLKSTLDKELGLDELRDAARPLPRVPGEWIPSSERLCMASHITVSNLHLFPTCPRASSHVW